MLSLNERNRGFGAIEVLLIVAVVGLIGLAGWFVYNNQSSKKSNSVTSAQKSSGTSKNTSKLSTTKDSPTTPQTTPAATVAFINVIQDDGSVTQAQPGQVGKTADQIAILTLLHEYCTETNKNVTLNHAFTEQYRQDGNYATLNVSECDPVVTNVDQLGGSGAGHYLHKNSAGTWVLDTASQMGPVCSKVDGLGYPKTIISQCLDDATGSARAPQ